MKHAGTWKQKSTGINYAALVLAEPGEEWRGQEGCVITVPLKWEIEPVMTFSGIWKREDFSNQFVLVKK